jgi:hypothetical protein
MPEVQELLERSVLRMSLSARAEGNLPKEDEMRSTRDLIKELEQEAREHSSAKLVALVVGFEHTSSFVLATDVNKLEMLNEFIKQGGEPFGFIRITPEGNGTGKAHVRTAAEYNKDEAIHR